MQRRLFCPILAAVVTAAALLGGVNRADAAIRIVISDGNTANDLVFYSSSSQVASFSTTFGGVDLVFQSTVSNFPGASTGGLLTQAITLSDPTGSGALPRLTFRSEVIQNVAVAPGFVPPADRPIVLAAPPLRFTLPPDGFLEVKSDVSGTGVTSGSPTVQNNTTVNNTIVSSLEVGINSDTDALITGAATNSPLGYTLSSEIVLEDLSGGFPALLIFGESSVSALTPEPGSLAFWALGGLGLVGVAIGRARRRSSSAPESK